MSGARKPTKRREPSQANQINSGRVGRTHQDVPRFAQYVLRCKRSISFFLQDVYPASCLPEPVVNKSMPTICSIEKYFVCFVGSPLNFAPISCDPAWHISHPVGVPDASLRHHLILRNSRSFFSLARYFRFAAIRMVGLM